MSKIDEITQGHIDKWLTDEYDEKTKIAVQHLIDTKDESELLDSFYKELEFGTGGLRGIMGVGPNRMNKYTIGKATQGLANYLKKQFANQEIKVAISYDSRNNSKKFGQLVADVFSSNDIKVYLFEELRPTPMLSFAVRHFGCQSGVMLTASHNPKEYNGYKAYWNDGGQLVSPHDNNVIEEANAIKSISEIKFEPKKENISLVKSDFDELYLEANYSLSINPEVVEQQNHLKIVYSPIHGTGITLVPKMLEKWGFKNVHIVEEQAYPDGNFPTVVYPNPEEEDAMALAVSKGEKLDAEIVLATDPDADRVGLAIKTNSGKMQLLNGNQIASLLTYYVLHAKREKGELSKEDYIVKTIVTTSLMSDIAADFGVRHYDTLTGFKFIGELISKLDGQETYLVGGEESYGLLVGSLVRDKDAINACAFIAEMAAYFKAKGQSLSDLILNIYTKYGCYLEKLISITKKGKEGADQIKAIMDGLRADKPKSLGGVTIKEIRDYNSSIITKSGGSTSPIDLPKSDVLQFITTEGDIISARPSGTEPKIKFYCSVKLPLDNPEGFDKVAVQLNEKADRMMKDLVKE